MYDLRSMDKKHLDKLENMDKIWKLTTELFFKEYPTEEEYIEKNINDTYEDFIGRKQKVDRRILKQDYKLYKILP